MSCQDQLRTPLIAFDAARAAGLSSERIVVFDVKGATTAGITCAVVEHHFE